MRKIMDSQVIFAIASLAALGLSTMFGLAQTANIVGLGATTCKVFNQDVERSAQVQRDYFAWAQGFMSGVLMRAPPGVDEGLELRPSTFPLLRQIEFLRSFCARNPDKDY